MDSLHPSNAEDAECIRTVMLSEHISGNDSIDDRLELY
jgi:hypothetical protein